MERSETLYSDPTITEAAARALECLPGNDDLHRDLAMRVLTAVTPLILANERKEIAEQARRYAGHYKEGSDGRNTFVMLAEWIEARP